MDETMSDPIAMQRVELKQLETDVATVSRITNDMLTMLRRATNAAEIGNAVAGMAPALAESVRAIQGHQAAASFALDSISRSAESRRQEAHHLRTLYSIGQAINSTLNLRDVLNLL